MARARKVKPANAVHRPNEPRNRLQRMITGFPTRPRFYRIIKGNAVIRELALTGENITQLSARWPVETFFQPQRVVSLRCPPITHEPIPIDPERFWVGIRVFIGSAAKPFAEHITQIQPPLFIRRALLAFSFGFCDVW